MNAPRQTVGQLHGIGVGPGDPDLITLRAIRALAIVDVVLAASSSRNEHSIALAIARPHIPAGTKIVDLAFPMTRDPAKLASAWDHNARTAIAILREGKNAAFLTLGDPLIYSTFGYLMRTVERLAPDIPLVVTPGISSFQAAAARTRTVLCESGENLLIQAGINDRTRLEDELRLADNAVLLKAYKNFNEIRAACCGAGRSATALLVSRLGQADERICPLDEAPDTPHYLSLVLAARKRE
jgi:precorrin-2/cobalt-factor-2 C20-methyltransferase